VKKSRLWYDLSRREGISLKSNTTEPFPNDGELDTQPANRQLKDGVFKLLFENPNNAAELYYALTGRVYP